MDKWMELLKELGDEDIEDRMILESLLQEEQAKLYDLESELKKAALELGKLKKRVEIFGEDDLNKEEQEEMRALPV